MNTKGKHLGEQEGEGRTESHYKEVCLWWETLLREEAEGGKACWSLDSQHPWDALWMVKESGYLPSHISYEVLRVVLVPQWFTMHPNIESWRGFAPSMRTFCPCPSKQLEWRYLQGQLFMQWWPLYYKGRVEPEGCNPIQVYSEEAPLCSAGVLSGKVYRITALCSQKLSGRVMVW